MLFYHVSFCQPVFFKMWSGRKRDMHLYILRANPLAEGHNQRLGVILKGHRTGKLVELEPV